MKPQTRTLAAALLALTALASSTLAQSRPGIDRPIRVGMFKGVGPGRLWHTNIHTANTVMAGILANPAGAGLGDSLVIPPAGFTFYSMPVALNTAGTAECTGNSCGPTSEQLLSITESLDTLDVLIMNTGTNIGSIITDPNQRLIFEAFWNTKGFVSIHGTTDTFGSWPQQDTVQGARFRGHPAEQNGNIRIDSVFAHEPHWQFLNRGLFSNSTDTTFFEEWIYFTEGGSTIRNRSHLKPTLKLNEASVASPGSQVAMGDHPMSWYREFPTGGRFFYTGVGHRSQVWQTTRTFRRQVYNAILWTAGYNNDGTVTIASQGVRGDAATASRFADQAHVSFSGGTLTVSLLRDGAHTIEILALDGRSIEARRGATRGEYTFANLRSGLHLIAVTTPGGRNTRLVTIP